MVLYRAFVFIGLFNHSCCRLWGVFVFVVCLFVLFGLCAYFVVFCLGVFCSFYVCIFASYSCSWRAVLLLAVLFLFDF